MDISNEQLEIVIKILDSHLSPNSTAWVFGSRLNKAKKKFSDLDLAISSLQKLPIHILASLQHDFSESDLPYKVDIVDLKNIDESFLKNIQSELKVIFKK